jgi:hypothetical protein
MKSREYIRSVCKQLTSPDHSEQASLHGAFLQAMLAVVADVESPLKEEAIVNLAVLEIRRRRGPALTRKKAA